MQQVLSISTEWWNAYGLRWLYSRTPTNLARRYIISWCVIIRSWLYMIGRISSKVLGAGIPLLIKALLRRSMYSQARGAITQVHLTTTVQPAILLLDVTSSIKIGMSRSFLSQHLRPLIAFHQEQKWVRAMWTSISTSKLSRTRSMGVRHRVSIQATTRCTTKGILEGTSNGQTRATSTPSNGMTRTEVISNSLLQIIDRQWLINSKWFVFFFLVTLIIRHWSSIHQQRCPHQSIIHPSFILLVDLLHPFLHCFLSSVLAFWLTPLRGLSRSKCKHLLSMCGVRGLCKLSL